MAKKSGARSKSKAPKSKTPPPEKAFERAAAPPGPQVRLVSSKEVLNRLKGLGRGWDEEIERLFSMPASLYQGTAETSGYYSEDRGFGIISLVRGMDAGSFVIPSKTSYGVAIYEKAGSVYFVLADLGRRIIVRERMLDYSDEPPEKGWSAVKEKIMAALSLAGSDRARNEGLIAVYDGILKTVKPQAPAEPPPVAASVTKP
jgi:hypothetical protein